jgi:hypothetical protein
MAISQIQYESLMSKKKLAQFQVTNIVPYFPTIKPNDYKRGYITRYFVQRSNDASGIVYEIAKEVYTIYVNNDFFLTTNLDWKLNGTNDEIRKANLKSIKLGAKKLPAIELYLVNPLQFVKV